MYADKRPELGPVHVMRQPKATGFYCKSYVSCVLDKVSREGGGRDREGGGEKRQRERERGGRGGVNPLSY